jgi:hypothetical protein
MDALARRLNRTGPAPLFFAALAFALLAFGAELVGIGVIDRIDLGRHVATPGYAQADFFPPLLAAVKVGIALLAARLAWRVLRARAIERAGLRLLGVVGHGQRRRLPRVRPELSPRLWMLCFALTSTIYLVHADLQAVAPGGRWPLLAPWLHTSALPVFAVLSVFVAVVWRVVARWLADYEGYARETLERGRRLIARLARQPLARPCGARTASARSLFGNSLHQRPPPLQA